MTLGKLIRMNTGFKSAPDNVFFSTQYCAGVKDFQCVPKTEIPSVTEATSNATRNALIAISVVMSVLVVSLVAVLVWLWFRSRQKRKIIPVKPAPGNWVINCHISEALLKSTKYMRAVPKYTYYSLLSTFPPTPMVNPRVYIGYVRSWK